MTTEAAPTILLNRRKALALLGGGAAALLAGCGSDDGTSAASSTTAGEAPASTSPATTSGECETIPEETAGPYPADGTNGANVLTEEGVVRQDIRSSFGSAGGTADGLPLTINLDLVDSTGCTALSGAAVYLWHCDREGRYSGYSDGVEDQNYLRGVQEADANGRVTFTSIFPGAYSGRWPHIHFEVYESLQAATGGGTRHATSQIALPEDACNAVYKTDGYAASVTNMLRTTLQNDNVFSDDEGEQQLGAAEGSVDDGFTVTLSVAVDPDHTSTGGSGRGAGTDGAPTGAPGGR